MKNYLLKLLDNLILVLFIRNNIFIPYTATHAVLRDVLYGHVIGSARNGSTEDNILTQEKISKSRIEEIRN